MTAEQLLKNEPEGAEEAQADGPVALIRSSFALVAPRAEEVARHFYATLFGLAPETRDLFPVNMEVQRSRLLRALVHVVQMVDRPDELVPFLEQLGRDHRKFGVWPSTTRRSAPRCSAPSRSSPVRPGRTESRRPGPTPTARWPARCGRRPGPSAARRPGWAGSWGTAGSAGTSRSSRSPRASRSRTGPASTSASRPRSARGCGVTSRRRTHPATTDGWSSTSARCRGAGSAVRSSRTRASATPGGSGPRWAGCTSPARAGGTCCWWRAAPASRPSARCWKTSPRGDGQPRTQVFVGGRTWDDLYDFAHLRRLSYSNPWLDVIPVVERDDAGTGGAEIGTLSEVVTRYGSWADHDVTVCGSPSMIRSTVAQMLVAGTPLDRISYDPFTVD